MTAIARRHPLHLLLALILLGGTVCVAFHNWFALGGPGLDFITNGPIYDSVVIAAGLACLLRAAAAPRERAAWILIGAAILAWAAAEVYWTWFILDNPSPPFPSPADAGYLAFYPLAIAGLAALVRARAHQLDPRLWLDGLIAALGTAALGTTFVFDVVFNTTTGTPLQVVTSLAYPLGDILVFSLIVGAIALTGWHLDRVWSLLLAGLATLVVADIAYTLQATGGVVPVGNWIDPIYLVAAVFLGLAAWQPVRPSSISLPSLDGWHELAVPIVCAAVMGSLFFMQYFGPASALSAALLAAAVLAIIVRLAVSVRENKSLLMQVRTDSLTGLGNRGKMELDLEARFSHAGAGLPTALILFDLNGFKHYNDTFGHPAGDALLERLGRNLREALGEDGAAYRIGGDEFCVMLTCAEERFNDATRAAAEALRAEDRGVRVASSWGVAVMPHEASDPSAALQLADVRMYAQKEARRVTDGSTIDPMAAPAASLSAKSSPAPTS
ncbi:MAG: GGDEF domain-containing protein [Solirubrobacterales bacterium]